MKTTLDAPYSEKEYRRRFLCEQVPLPIGKSPRYWILDKYLVDTQIRLRQLIAPEAMHYSLTKKQGGSQPHQMVYTTPLSAKEYELLNLLPAYELQRTRYILSPPKHTLYIDQLLVDGQKYILIQACFEHLQLMNDFQANWVYEREVSDEQTFTDYELAKKNTPDLELR